MTTVSVKRGYGIVFNKMNTISLSLTYSLFLTHYPKPPLMHAAASSAAVLRAEGIYSFWLKSLSR